MTSMIPLRTSAFSATTQTLPDGTVVGDSVPVEIVGVTPTGFVVLDGYSEDGVAWNAPALSVRIQSEGLHMHREGADEIGDRIAEQQSYVV